VAFGVAALFPCGDFGGEQGAVGQALGKALAIEDADFDFRHVEPAGMFRGVVEDDPAELFPKGFSCGVLSLQYFLARRPVAYHCIFVLGFEANDTRVYIHSLLGSFLYGAVFAKVLIVRSDGFGRWALPLAGGVLFSIIAGLWLTSAFWFFRTVGIAI
jgi:hypothetical protein